MESINIDNHDTFVGEGIKVLAFKAGWCGPCRMLTPVLEEMDETNEVITVGTVDVDEENELAMKYGIRNIPTTLFIKDGEVKQKVTGAKSKGDLELILNELSA
jgi:thioredoxin 1